MSNEIGVECKTRNNISGFIYLHDRCVLDIQKRNIYLIPAVGWVEGI